MGDPISWYLLTRTVDDLQSIMEAIDAKLLTHNQDPSAHGQTGEVVETHRAEPELDHPFGSVDFRHLVNDNILISTCFDTFDGWDAGGNNICHVFDSEIYTTNVVNNTSWIALYTEQNAVLLDPTKNPYFQTTVYFSSAADQEAYIMLGGTAGGPEGSAFGYKVVDGSLYACWYGGGAERTQIIAGITLTNTVVLRAYCDSSVSEIYFYVNGELKYTATTNYPTGANTDWFIYWIKTTAAAVKHLFLVDLYIEQER